MTAYHKRVINAVGGHTEQPKLIGYTSLSHFRLHRAPGGEAAHTIFQVLPTEKYNPIFRLYRERS